MERIDADLLIPGRGEPVRDASVVLDGPTIAYAGSRDALPADLGAADGPPDVTAAVVMPGMWDAHGHFVGLTTEAIDAMPRVPVEYRTIRATKDAERALQAGFTSVREAGGLGVFLARAVADGTITGPSIYAPGAILSTTGGHGDLHGYPLDWVRDYARRDAMFRLCDGVDDCVRAVREQLRLDAKVIKICASGGVLSEVDDPIHQQFTVDEMRAIVETAAMAERAVMAHCHGKPGMLAALEAGVLTIEHGTYVDEEVADAMVEQDAILVPTRTIVDGLLGVGDRGNISPASWRKLQETGERHHDAVALAHERGVRIALGTDIYQSDPALPVSWGRNARELELLVTDGMTPLEAIEAATATGPETLGPLAPKSGQLAVGFDADLLTLSRDPLQDVSVLADPATITGVWKAGVRVRGGGDG